MDLNSMNLSPKKLQELLNLAAKKMGMTPEELKKQVESGKFDYLLNSSQGRDAIRKMQQKK